MVIAVLFVYCLNNFIYSTKHSTDLIHNKSVVIGESYGERVLKHFSITFGSQNYKLNHLPPTNFKHLFFFF